MLVFLSVLNPCPKKTHNPIFCYSQKTIAYYVPFLSLLLCLFVTVPWKDSNLQKEKANKQKTNKKTNPNTLKSKLKNLDARKRHNVSLRVNSKLTCP